MIDIFTAPGSSVTFEDVRTFVLAAEAADGLRESAILELKRSVSKQNVVRAVAGLANADGGLVLVGVLEDAVGDARLVGAPPQQFDALATQLRMLLEPPVEPEIITVLVPGANGRLIGVVRVNADDLDRPVVLNGQVFVRGLGATLPARRGQLLALVTGARSAAAGFGMPGAIPLSVDHSQLWTSAAKDSVPELEIRLRARVRLAPSSAHRALLDSVVKQRVLAATQSYTAGPLARLAVGRSAEAGSWAYTRARSDQLHARVRLESTQGLSEQDRVSEGVGGRFILQRHSRDIELLIGFGVSPWRDGTGAAIREDPQSGAHALPEGRPLRLDLRRLFETLVGLRLIACEIFLAAAGADADLARQTETSAALIASNGNLEELVDLGSYLRDDSEVSLTRYTFKTTVPQYVNFVRPMEVDLVVWWLSHLLLDVGARDFEADLQQLSAPCRGEIIP